MSTMLLVIRRADGWACSLTPTNQPHPEFGTTTEVDAGIGKMALETEASESHMLDAVRTAIDLLKQQEKAVASSSSLVSDGIDVNNEKKKLHRNRQPRPARRHRHRHRRLQRI